MRPAGPALLWAALLTFTTVATSGCLDALAEPAATGEEPAVSQAEPKGKNGDLIGTVVNSVGSPLADASVVLLGTSEARTTGTDGRFEFLSLPEAEYVMRVDHVMYRSQETLVAIVKHNTTEVTVSLVPANGCEPHMHDWWGGNTAVVLAEMNVNLNGNGSSQDPMNVVQSGVLDPTFGGPNREFRIPKGSFVFPGTANLTVMFSWVPSATNTVDQVGFAFKSADTDKTIRMPTKGSGASIWVALSPAMPDSGHARETAWKFYYYFPSGQGPNIATGTMHVKMTIEKGTVPIDGSCVGHPPADQVHVHEH